MQPTNIPIPGDQYSYAPQAPALQGDQQPYLQQGPLFGAPQPQQAMPYQQPMPQQQSPFVQNIQYGQQPSVPSCPPQQQNAYVPQNYVPMPQTQLQPQGYPPQQGQLPPQMLVPQQPLFVYKPFPPRCKYNRKYWEAAEALRRAMKGIGTDNKKVIEIISSYTSDELVEIGQQFEASFGRNLQDELEKELSGNYGDLAGSMFTHRYISWAQKVHRAIDGLGTDEKALMDLIVMCSPQDLEQLRYNYYYLYGKDMYREISEDINNVQSWCFFLKCWMRQAKNDAGDPMNEVQQLIRGDDRVFTEIICMAGPNKYRQIVQLYEHTTKQQLAKVIEKKFYGKFEQILLLGHYFNLSPQLGISYILYRSMKGLGTNDTRLKNATALFRDRYWQGISESYSVFGNLTKDFKGDLTGNYEKLVLTLWNLK